MFLVPAERAIALMEREAIAAFASSSSLAPGISAVR
jgi:hypothetical protein